MWRPHEKYARNIQMRQKDVTASGQLYLKTFKCNQKARRPHENYTRKRLNANKKFDGLTNIIPENVQMQLKDATASLKLLPKTSECNWNMRRPHEKYFRWKVQPKTSKCNFKKCDGQVNMISKTSICNWKMRWPHANYTRKCPNATKECDGLVKSITKNIQMQRRNATTKWKVFPKTSKCNSKVQRPYPTTSKWNKTARRPCEHYFRKCSNAIKNATALLKLDPKTSKCK